MCGRYSLSTPQDLVEEIFDAQGSIDVESRYNIAPTEEAAVVRADDRGRRELVSARWGLVPRWTGGAPGGAPTINARGETAAELPTFRDSFRRRRCLVPADGFFEWQRRDRVKQPFYFTMSAGEPFAFAGLWDRWESGAGPLESFTILTTSPNELVEPLHDRMPAILPRTAFASWLDRSIDDPDFLGGLLAPYPAGAMTGVPVSRYVNRAGNEGPRCVEPVELERPPENLSLWD